MKKLNFLLLLLLVVFVFGSCQKDESPVTEIVDTSDSIIATSSFDSRYSCIDKIDESQIHNELRITAKSIHDQLIQKKVELQNYGTPIFEAMLTTNGQNQDEFWNVIPFTNSKENALKSLLFFRISEKQFVFFVFEVNAIKGQESLAFDLEGEQFPIDTKELIDLTDAFNCYIFCENKEGTRGPECPRWGPSIGDNFSDWLHRVGRKIGSGINSINPHNGDVYDDDSWIFTDHGNSIPSGMNLSFGGGGGGSGIPSYWYDVVELQECLGLNDVHDTGPGNPNSTFPGDVELCTQWNDYLANCLPDVAATFHNNFEHGDVNEPYHIWGKLKNENPQLFMDITSGVYGCVGTDELESYGEIDCNASPDEFLNTYNIHPHAWDLAGGPEAGCCSSDGDIDEACALFTYLSYKLDLDDNEACLANNLSELQKIHSFWQSHNTPNADDCEKNLSTAVANAYADSYCDDALADFDYLTSTSNNNVLHDIMKEQLIELVKELVADFIPGGTLATVGPELLNNVQGGEWMDAMFNTFDIVLNELDACVPIAKVGSLAIGMAVSAKHLKKAYTAFKKAKALGNVFLEKLYNVLVNRLNWDPKDIKTKFQWKDNTTGVKVDGVSSSNFLQKIKEEFGDDQMIFTGTNGYPIFKILEIPFAPDSCVYMEMYPDSNSGFAWTIGFYTGSCSANNADNFSQKFKIRFDN